MAPRSPAVFILLIQLLNRVQAKHWPCPIGQPNPTCPGFPSQPCVPFTYSCPPPPCQVDAECVPLRCLRPPPPPLAGQQQQQSVVGVCQDFPEPKPPGTKCTQHSDCGMLMLCAGGKCEDGDRIGRPGSYRPCTRSDECPPGERCEQGICLIPQGDGEDKSKQEQNQLEEGQELNVWSSGWCSAQGRCPATSEAEPEDVEESKEDEEEICIFLLADSTQGQCFARRFFNDWGQMIPPPPGHPWCRDANSPPGQHSLYCRQRRRLCTDGIYWRLMAEQCPRTCLRCQDSLWVEQLRKAGMVRTVGGRRGGAELVEVAGMEMGMELGETNQQQQKQVLEPYNGYGGFIRPRWRLLRRYRQRQKKEKGVEETAENGEMDDRRRRRRGRRPGHRQPTILNSPKITSSKTFVDYLLI